MSVGDCFDLPDPESDSISDVTQRECTEPHQYEMYFVGDLPDGQYPSDSDVDLWLEANCLPAFTEYVGIDYQSSSPRRATDHPDRGRLERRRPQRAMRHPRPE